MLLSLFTKVKRIRFLADYFKGQRETPQHSLHVVCAPLSTPTDTISAQIVILLMILVLATL
jgi:hypothetical protein